MSRDFSSIRNRVATGKNIVDRNSRYLRPHLGETQPPAIRSTSATHATRSPHPTPRTCHRLPYFSLYGTTYYRPYRMLCPLPFIAEAFRWAAWVVQCWPFPDPLYIYRCVCLFMVLVILLTDGHGLRPIWQYTLGIIAIWLVQPILMLLEIDNVHRVMYFYFQVD